MSWYFNKNDLVVSFLWVILWPHLLFWWIYPQELVILLKSELSTTFVMSSWVLFVCKSKRMLQGIHSPHPSLRVIPKSGSWFDDSHRIQVLMRHYAQKNRNSFMKTSENFTCPNTWWECHESYRKVWPENIAISWRWIHQYSRIHREMIFKDFRCLFYNFVSSLLFCWISQVLIDVVCLDFFN